MIKIFFFTLSAVLSFLLTPWVAHANDKQDPLQNYRDEIKRLQANASQTVFDQLKSTESTDFSNVRPHQSTPAIPPRSFSNTEKAFSISPTPQNSDASSNKKPNVNDNPWLKPNPWDAQAKVNPWANVPVPDANNPTPPVTQTPPPPNIFAPTQPAGSMSNKSTNYTTR